MPNTSQSDGWLKPLVDVFYALTAMGRIPVR